MSTRDRSMIVALVLVVLTVQCFVAIVSKYGDDTATRAMRLGATLNVKDKTISFATGDNSSPSLLLQQQQQGMIVQSNSAGTCTQGRGPIGTTSTISQYAEPLPVVFEGVRARAFDSWPENRTLPCFPPELDWKTKGQLPAEDGLIFLKTYKTGSSTASGVNLRIARNVARRQNTDYAICNSRFDHAWASKLYSNRNPMKSFLWSIVRDPTERVVSQWFHFAVSRSKIEPSDRNFRAYLLNGPTYLMDDYYLGALSLKGYKHGIDDPVVYANTIMDDYDFIAVTERLNESLVAMAMLIGVPIADILYLTAKGHGGYDAGGGRSDGRTICTFIWPSFVSEGMRDILDSEQWRKMSHWDTVFYKAANRSLDLTIDRLGRNEFEKNLAMYENARAVSRERCLGKAVFPCSSGGKYTPANETDCLWKDSGCGSECLDEVADELNLW